MTNLGFDAFTEIHCIQDTDPVYIPVEHLQVGDCVQTLGDGDRTISHIGSSFMGSQAPVEWQNRFFRLPKTKAMTKDLIVTGLHTLFFDTPEPGSRPVKIGGHLKYAIFAGKSNRTVEEFEIVGDASRRVYHFSLKSDGKPNRVFAVWADGMLAETTPENEFIHEDGVFFKKHQILKK